MMPVYSKEINVSTCSIPTSRLLSSQWPCGNFNHTAAEIWTGLVGDPSTEAAISLRMCLLDSSRARQPRAPPGGLRRGCKPLICPTPLCGCWVGGGSGRLKHESATCCASPHNMTITHVYQVLSYPVRLMDNLIVLDQPRTPHSTFLSFSVTSSASEQISGDEVRSVQSARFSHSGWVVGLGWVGWGGGGGGVGRKIYFRKCKGQRKEWKGQTH